MKVNLRDFYPEIYSYDHFCDLPTQVVEFMKEDKRSMHAQKEKIRRNKAYYSTDRGDGVGSGFVMQEPSVEERYSEKETKEMIYLAISHLPKKQARWIIAHFLLGMSKAEIARIEKVDHAVIVRSIQRGLNRLKKFLENGHFLP